MRAMAEVEPEDIDPGLGKGLDRARGTAGGSERGDDARAAGSVHVWSVTAFPRAPCGKEPAPLLRARPAGET